MKIIIIGGGITGLYIGYMLNKYNIDFDIYERSSMIGGKLVNKKIFDKKVEYQIYHHHMHMINLLKELNIDYKIVNKVNDIKFDTKLFEKIKQIFDKNPVKNITVDTFMKNNLSESEYNLFISYISDLKLNQMEISNYIKYNHDNILLINRSKETILINHDIIDKLSLNIRNNIYINYNVQQIAYMPITNNYILTVNDKFINADKVILTSNMGIHLIIPPIIQKQFLKIESFNYLKIYYQSPDKKISTLDYITKDQDILYESIIQNKETAINILNAYLNNKDKILKYTYQNWKNAYHINKYTIETNFYNKYNMILAIHPYSNSLEGSCVCAKDTFDIIQNEIYSKRSEYLFKII